MVEEEKEESPEKSEEESMPTGKKTSSGNKNVLFIVLILLIVGIAGGIYLYFANLTAELTGEKPLSIRDLLQIGGDVPVSEIVPEYVLRDGKIVENVPNGESEVVLFENVSNVSRIRMGPYGRTIHFKVDGEEYQAYCADLLGAFDPPGSDYPDPPPQQAPWDYERIGHAYTIPSCGEIAAGGFLKNSNHFVHLELVTPDEGYLVVENLETGNQVRVQVDADLLGGFNDGDENTVNSYWADFVRFEDGSALAFPRQDAYFSDENKLVLAFSRFIIGIDLNTEKILGGFGLTQDDYSVIATSFWFNAEGALPYVVIDSGWEGFIKLQALVDVDGDEMKVVNLSERGESILGFFDVERVKWVGDVVQIAIYKSEDVTDLLENELETYFDLEGDALKDAEKNQAKKILDANGEYDDVVCFLEPGIFTGCSAAKLDKLFIYSKDSGLVQNGI